MIASRRTSTIVEGADYLLDLEAVNPVEKRLTCSKLKAAMKDHDVDEIYTSFLDGLLELWEAKLVEEDDDDPAYILFLNDLRGHGNAYMLDVSMEHGVFNPIKYEVEDETTDELKRKTLKSRRFTLMRESRSLDLDGALKSGAKTIGTLRSGAKKMGALKENTHRRIRKRSSLFMDGELNSDLKSSGSEMENNQGHSHRILENIQFVQREYPVCEPSQVVDCSSSDQNCSSNSRPVTVDEVYKAFLAGLKVDGQSVFYEYEVGKRAYYEMGDQERSTDVDIHLPKTAPRTQCVTPRPSAPHPRLQTSALRQPTPTPTPTPTPRQPPPRQSSSPRQQTHSTAKNHRIVFNASNKMLKNNGRAFQSEHSWFWKRLKTIVREPYKHQEYRDCWQKVTDRRPIEVHKETRTGGYKSAPGHLGKSYLEVHPDLECEIEKVKTDHPKVLNLLRGFFFYLKYVPHGVPRPWMSDFGKKILLGSHEDHERNPQESL